MPYSKVTTDTGFNPKTGQINYTSKNEYGDINANPTNIQPQAPIGYVAGQPASGPEAGKMPADASDVGPLAVRAETGLNDLTNLIKNGYDPTSLTSGIREGASDLVGKVAPSLSSVPLSNDQIKYNANVDQINEALHRGEYTRQSNPQQWEKDMEMYPKAGDTPSVVATKLQKSYREPFRQGAQSLK